VTVIHDITPHTGLQPKKKYFEEVGDVCINADGCIELVKQTDTPEARTIYRAYRKRLASNVPAATAEKTRENAFFDALADIGIRTSFTKISGDMS
jgi:hypothetical protein